ncbi:MAG: DMT family transporter [Bacteroidota bacterium]|nr:DMT family transporter [Bacteroidota bacterium]
MNTSTLLALKTKKETLKGSLLVLVGASGYGLLSPIAKLAYRKGLSADMVSVGQVLMGAIMVGIILMIQTLAGTKSDVYIKPSAKQKLLLTGAGTFLGFTTVFIYKALVLLPASIGIVLLFQFTWMGIVMDVILTRKRPDKTKIISLLILIAGTLLASGAAETSRAHLNTMGIVWGLLAAMSYTLVIYVSGNTVTEAAPFTRTFYMSVGSLVVTLLCFPPETIINTISNPEMLKWGIMLGLLGVVVSPVLLNKGLPSVSLALGTIISAAELPVVVITSIIILDEHVSPLKWLGVCGILLAIALPYFLNNNQK